MLDPNANVLMCVGYPLALGGAVTLIMALTASSRTQARWRYMVVGAVYLVGGLSRHAGIIIGLCLGLSLLLIASLAGVRR